MPQPIYQPEQDSYLLEKEIKQYIKDLDNKNIKVLDMGSGSGIQAKACIKSGIKQVLAVDINPLAIKHLKKQKLRTQESNLFSKIKGKFDLIIFNAPYLPEHENEKGWDTTAGKKGYEIITKFLKQSTKHLNKQGTILLLFSNLSKPNIIKKHATQLKYKYKKLSEKGMGFFEKLYVYEFKL
jgi:release factor glutamine methyltransferase